MMKEALDYSESNLAQAQAVSDITPTDCICSLLWIYITRARHLASHMPNEEKSVFTTTVDMRNFFDRGVGLASYFGNLFMTVSREEQLDHILSVVEERGKQYLDSEFLENIISRAYGQRGRLGSWVNEERFRGQASLSTMGVWDQLQFSGRPRSRYKLWHTRHRRRWNPKILSRAVGERNRDCLHLAAKREEV